MALKLLSFLFRQSLFTGAVQRPVISRAPIIYLCGSVCLLFLTGNAGRAQTIGEALDATNLTWTTGGAYWQGETNVTHDGIDAAVCGRETIWTIDWIETGVSGPTAVAFWWKASSVPNESPLSFSISGQIQTSISGVVDWQRRSFFVPPGNQTLRWTFSEKSMGSAVSNRVWLDQVSLSEPEAPKMVIDPSELTVAAGEPLALGATVSGTEPLGLQWRINETSMAGATNASLVISNAQAINGGYYTLCATNPLGAVTSQVVRVTVTPAIPTFTLQPISQGNILGSSLTLRSGAKGTEPLIWQWFQGAVPLPGETNPVLSITNLQMSNLGDYVAVVTNQVGSTTSQVATVTAILAPVFTRQPSSQGAAPGATMSFTAAAQGSGMLSWQWYFNGQEIAGTSNRLFVTNVQGDKMGSYQVIVTNQFGSATSALAVLGPSPIVVWGDSADGEAEVPLTATNVIALAGGDYHSLAVRKDGTVVTWGVPPYGGPFPLVTNVPPEATNVVGVAAGSFHGLALREDGTVIKWGYIMGGDVPVPAEATNVVALALGPGAQHAVALRGDGTVVDWGGKTTSGSPLRRVPPEATNVIAVSAGAYHSTALKADGTVIGWNESQTVKTRGEYVAIATGWYHNLALRADGTLFQWGGDASTGTVPQGASNVLMIACGGNHSLALGRDGRLLAWGANGHGETNVPPWATNLTAITGLSDGNLALVGQGAPVIVAHPMSLPALLGDNYRMTGSAIGAQPLTYQWLRNGTPLAGADRPWLVMTNVQPDNGIYALMASNAFGVATSRVATVTIAPTPPRRITVPTVVPAVTDSTARITAAAFGSEPLSYTWQFGSKNLEDSARLLGTHTATLSIRGVQSSDFGNYTVVASNPYGSLTSSVVQVRLATAEEAVGAAVDAPQQSWQIGSYPYFRWVWQTNTTHDGVAAAQSQNATTYPYSAVMTTYFSGPGAVSFWWKVSSQTNAHYLHFLMDKVEQARISGTVDWHQRSFRIPPGDHALVWKYQQDASISQGQDCGWVDEVSFGMPVLPAVSVQPTQGIVSLGSGVTLSAAATGTEPFAYQWRLNGADIPGRTNSTLAITTAQYADTGTYSVQVTNAAGSTTSPGIALVVVPVGVTSHPWIVPLSPAEIQINWSLGTLESAESITGPWLEVAGAKSPLTEPTSGRARFYRVRLP